MRIVISILVLALLQVNLMGQPLILSPAINPDGDQIAFSYQGDIWTVSIDGGRADRLTIHEGYESNPFWTADGNSIVFQSDRFGNNDIFAMPAVGGMPDRLTYHSASDNITDVTPNGEVYFITRRNYAAVEREWEIYKTGLTGGTPQRAMDALGFDATISPDGTKIAFVRGTCRVSREDYRGPANRDVWVYDITNDAYTQVTDFEGNDFAPQWLDDQTLVFISPRDGKYNLFRQSLDGNAMRITDEQEFGINSYSLSNKAQTLVYQAGDQLKAHDLSTNETTSVSINVNSDFRFDPVLAKDVTNKIDAYSISPNGDYAAYIHRGELFITRNDKEDSRSVRLTTTAARERDPVWLNDNTILFLSDREGQYDLFAIQSDNDEPIFKSLKHKTTQITNTEIDEFTPIVAPDGKQLYYRQGRGKMLIADLSEDLKLANIRVLQDGWATPDGVSWSPDSKWLAYSIDDLYFNNEVYIHKADNSQSPVNVSMHPKDDVNPQWSPDGSKLGFVSMRNNGDYDVWFAWLKKEDYEKTREEWERLEKDEAEDENTKGEINVEIDLNNIYQRLVQVTAFTGNESSFSFSKDGDYIYYAIGSSGRQDYKQDRDLYKIKWDGKDQKSILTGDKQPSDLQLSADQESIFLLTKGGQLHKLTTKDDKIESYTVKSQLKIDYPGEWEQVFEEAWRNLRYGFYDPNFHGKDWTALKEKYKPLAMKASTKEDFQYIFNLMLGQVNASHMGLYRGENPKDTQEQKSGLLGIEGTMTNTGYRITKVLAGSPAARTESQLAVGDIITRIDHEALDTRINIYALLLDKANEPVLLQVQRTGGNSEEVIIWPASSLSDQLYDDWVETRRALVDDYSNGRLGYLHIRGMNWTSFERFERELTAAGHGKEGIVIDVRYNGGGWTTDYLMAVLNVRQHAYTVPRGASENLDNEHLAFKETYPFAERLPLASWTKPSIALCNESSYSNAEIFSHAYKTLDLGTLVGQPTFGAVISTGGEILIDGSLIRMPFRAWYVKATEENMELGPAVPDILVENPPAYRARKVDPQLERSVNELLSQIDR